ncbi:hypothetical protein [Phaeobacter sp. SYSU ZJ3003]|uniref:hypothetical protein n=1 Tax=Phaeobacter sp. SYSU ZJ3003 TaxID=2109330 RepID=UPI00351BFA26
MEEHIKTPLQMKRVFIAGIRKVFEFYAVSQTDSRVQMVRWAEEEIDIPPYFIRYYEREETVFAPRGNLLPITRLDHFDKLYKGVLNELDLYVDIEDLEEVIEYQRDDHLFEMHADPKHLTPPSAFKTVSFDHVFIRVSDLEKIFDTISGADGAKENKQVRREKIFISWLKDKDHQAVSNMRKSDVWMELNKLDRTLFGVEPKNFFRDQKIITFKSGRKPN